MSNLSSIEIPIDNSHWKIDVKSNNAFKKNSLLLENGRAYLKGVKFRNSIIEYSGDNTYRTRDYRFLGSIGFFDTGFFDTLHLPLKKGYNEIWMAVSESFGGWGVQAQFVDSKRVTILP